jgi:nucleotide-binding universal stress UspA family protein
MSDEPSEITVKRILVALDASAHSLSALEAATALAARMRAELLGVFVEDINLLRLSALPFARELVYGSDTARQMSSSGMERTLKAQAERIRRQLEAAAEKMQVRWSFRVARGEIISEVLAVAPEADMLILGKAGRSLRPAGQMGSIARAVSQQAKCTVMLLRQGAWVDKPVVVLFDGSPLGRRALSMAAHLAQEDDKNLVVLISSADVDQRARLQRQADELLVARGIHARFVPLVRDSAEEIARRVSEADGKVLVLGAATAGETAGVRERLLDKIDAPVLLVR